MAMDPKAFIAAMERWREQFAKGAELPIIGASEKDLNSIKVPTCIIPGNDKTHNHAVAEAAHRMIRGSELHDLFPGDLDVDLVPTEDWAPKEREMAGIFADFLARRRPRRPSVRSNRIARTLRTAAGCDYDARLETVGGITNEAQHAATAHHPYRKPAAARRRWWSFFCMSRSIPAAKASQAQGRGAPRRQRGRGEAGCLRARHHQ